MTELEAKIARMYLLPRRPFLYGMARAFDLFRVLDRGKRQTMLDGFKVELRRPSDRMFKSTWQALGDMLISDLKAYAAELEARQR